MNLYNLLLKAEEKYGKKKIIEELNIVSGTYDRWKTKQEVPKDYLFDLMRICELEINYNSFTPKEKNQYFTPLYTVKYCFNIVQNELSRFVNLEEYYWIEPSAGSGNFLSVLPPEKFYALDVEPKHELVQKINYFDWHPPVNKKTIVIGNPPFGLRGQQALKFINKALKESDFVCFILPPLFNSDGRGTPKKRIKGKLLGTWECDSSYNYPDGSPVKVQTIFQIWTRLDIGEDKVEENVSPNGYKIYSLSDGGTPGTTRNKDKIDKCDFYLPSTCFGEEKMNILYNFKDLPQQRGYGIIVENKEILEKAKKIDWKKISFNSTNGALNLRMSLIINALNKKEN